jgi:tetratricopeptide (TPR) repeat protein
MTQASSLWPNDPILAELAEVLSQRLAQGGSADVEAFLAEHPEQANELRQLIPTMQTLVGLGSTPHAGQLSGEMLLESLGPDANHEQILGDFRILREVGRGGMGIVYEAEQISLHRRVALKVLPTASMLDPRALQRFSNEARAAAALHHSQIAPIFGVGCDRGVHYYAMQYIDGLTLAEVIGSLRASPERADKTQELETSAHNLADDRMKSTAKAGDDAETDVMAALSTEKQSNSLAHFRRFAELFAQVADALEHAHEVGVTHRDIKPANLMLDRLGRIWVTDFGLARIEGAGNITLTGDIVGTLRYMSPEQLLAKPLSIDHRTDIYSLGITLYELLALTPAFDGEGRQELVRQISEVEPLPLRKRNPAIPRDLETIVLKATQKAPKDRYESAADLAADLKRFVEDRHILARRPSITVRTTRWIRRYKDIVATASLLLLIASIAALVWAIDRSQRTAYAEARIDEALQESAIRRAAAEATGDDLVAWEQSVGAAKRASAIAESSVISLSLRSRVQNENSQLQSAYQQTIDRMTQSAKDARMLLELSQARTDLFGQLIGNGLDDRRYRARCEEAFRDYGIDIEALRFEQSEALLRTSAIRESLITGLISWAIVRPDPAQGKPTRSSLLKLAEGATGSFLPWQKELIDALQSENLQKLQTIANSKRIDGYPPEAAFCLGMALKSQGDRNAAINLTKRVLGHHPGDFLLNMFVGDLIAGKRLHDFDELSSAEEVAVNSNQLAEAIRFLTAAIALQPDSATPRTMLGTALRIQKRYDEALVACEQAIQLAPENAAARSSIALVLESQGKEAEAIAAHREAIRLDPSYAIGHMNLANTLAHQGKVEEALAAYRLAIRVDPTVASIHYNLARLLKGNGQIHEAELAYRNAIRIDPSFVQAFNNLGSVLRLQGKLDEAVNAYREAIRLNPAHIRACMNLGIALKHQGKLEEAVEVYREAIRLKPDAAEAYTSMADAFIRQDKWGDALAAVREAIQLKPRFADAYYVLGRVLVEQEKFDEAAKSYRQAIELKPNFPEAFFNLAEILQEQKRCEDAVAAYREAIRIYPAFAEANKKLGDTLRLQQQLAESEAAYREAVRLVPTDAETLSSLGFVLQSQGKSAQAEAVCREAIRISPDQLTAHSNLGAALASQGKYADAVEAFCEAIRLDPTNENSRANLARAEQYLKLEAKFENAIRLPQTAISVAERLDLAFYAIREKDRPDLAVQWFEQVMKESPALADDLDEACRYNAACAALLTASNEVEKAVSIEEEEKTRLWRKALVWLQDDLRAWEKKSLELPADKMPEAVQILESWKKDLGLASLRNAEQLKMHSAEDQELCRKLWADHAEIVKRLREKVIDMGK